MEDLQHRSPKRTMEQSSMHVHKQSDKTEGFECVPLIGADDKNVHESHATKREPPSSPSKTERIFGPSACVAAVSAYESLPKATKFLLLASGVFTFFGLHNYLQEAIMHFEGFSYGWYLGFLEVLGVTFFSFFERRVSGEKVRKGSMKAYAAVTLCLMGSSSLSNIALNYINYPTKVVFRSCKLIPTMIIAGVINKRSFGAVDYASAAAITGGLILFAFADFTVSPTFNPLGIGLVTVSVFCDAILPNLQERLFRAGASRVEVTFFTNIFTLLSMTGSMLLSGDLIGATTYALTHRTACTYMIVYTVLAYVAISLHMAMVKQFGSVAAVLVGNTRKAMTITCSFIFFPKPFTMEYAFGGAFVLGGLTASAWINNKSSKQQQQPQHPEKEGGRRGP